MYDIFTKVFVVIVSSFGRIRLAFEAIFHKSTTLQDVEPSGGINDDKSERASLTPNVTPCPSLPPSPGPNKKVQLVSI